MYCVFTTVDGMYIESMEMDGFEHPIGQLPTNAALKRDFTDDTNEKFNRALLERKVAVLAQRGINDMRVAAPGFDRLSDTTLGRDDMGTQYFRWGELLCRRPQWSFDM